MARRRSRQNGGAVGAVQLQVGRVYTLTPREARQVLVMPSMRVYEDSRGYDRVFRSVCNRGVIVPILVVPAGEEGRFYVVDGVVRARAAMECNKPLPVILLTATPVSTETANVIRYVVNTVRVGSDESVISRDARDVVVASIVTSMGCDAMRDTLHGSMRSDVVREVATQLGMDMSDAREAIQSLISGSDAMRLLAEAYNRMCRGEEREGAREEQEAKPVEEEGAAEEKRSEETVQGVVEARSTPGVAVSAVSGAGSRGAASTVAASQVRGDSEVRVVRTDVETRVVRSIDVSETIYRSEPVRELPSEEYMRCGDEFIPSKLYDQAMYLLSRISGVASRALNEACRAGLLTEDDVRRIVEADSDVERIKAVLSVAPIIRVNERIPVQAILVAARLNNIARMPMTDAIDFITLIGAVVADAIAEKDPSLVTRLFAAMSTYDREKILREVIEALVD